jgi:single-strand DNA-binding protein
MYNKIILAGHLTRDIELKHTQGGSAIGNSAIATSRKFKSQTGEQKEETLFVDITFFGRTAEVANQYLRKGSKVLVEGRLKLDNWTAQDGTKRSKHSVVVENMTMLGNKGETESGPMPTDIYGGRDQEAYIAPSRTPQNTYSKPAYEKPAYSTPDYQKPVPQSSQSLPEIDINEEEIPF